MCIDLTVRMETSTRIADAANCGNIELAGTKHIIVRSHIGVKPT